MKKVLIPSLIATIILGVSGVMLAADQATNAPAGLHRHPLLAHLAKVLNLTDQQKTQIKDILATARADVKKAPDKDTKKAIRKAAIQKIFKDVLTDDQRAKLKELKGRFKGHAGGHAAPAA